MPSWTKIIPGGLWHIATDTPGIACNKSFKGGGLGVVDQPPLIDQACRRCEKLRSPPIPSCARCGRPVPAGQGVVTWRGRRPHGHHAARCLDTEVTLGHGEVLMEEERA